MIPFKSIPAGLRLPGMYAELDASQANTASGTQRVLIIGQITSAGTLTPNVPVRSAGTGDAKAGGGAGSILANMVWAYRQNDAYGEVWYLPLADLPGAASATGSFTVTGQATAAGTLNVYIAGQLVTVPVSNGATAAQIAAAAVAAIAASIDLPVTAAIEGGNPAKVDLTAKNAGLVHNDVDLRVNYRGTVGNEALPAGVGITFVAMSGGAGNPALGAALAALGTQPFDFIVSPYTDAASIAAISGLLNDQTGRWAGTTQIYGHCFIALRGTQGTLATFGTGLNDQHLTCMGFAGSPSPNYLWAAAVTGAYAPSVRNDPALPAQTLAIAGVLAPPVPAQFLPTQRAALLYDGIATFTVDPAGAVRIERLVTTYQLNTVGQADNSYLDTETLFTLMAVLRAYALLWSTTFTQLKLGQDGVRYPPSANVVTPSTIKASLVALYRQLETDVAWVQASDAFAAAVQVIPNASSPGRVDVLLPIVLIGQLRQMAMLVQFHLQ